MKALSNVNLASSKKYPEVFSLPNKTLTHARGSATFRSEFSNRNKSEVFMLEPKTLDKRYERIFNQLEELLRRTDNRIARMATIIAILHHKLPHYFWTGFYIHTGNDLIVGPYQGPLACQVLEREKGVCWAGFLNKETIIVPDVHKFAGHIACDSRSNSEIVVPLADEEGHVWAVLDVDSKVLDAFSSIDQHWLEKIVRLVGGST
jgi:L-methionine (R)-S-oxide reductase